MAAPVLSGWLNIDKPLGITSNDVVMKIRRLLQTKKVGHAGTLDPLASGILPIALGEATKTIAYAQDASKEYLFTLRFGQSTTTDDTEGEVIAENPHRPSLDEIKNCLHRFTGLIQQTPPPYSALKINGVRAYDLARKGESVELAARPVQIDQLECLNLLDTDHAQFRVQCGKGTYVRALGRDIATHLGTVGHLTALRRTKVGCFIEKTAISLDKLAEIPYEDRIVQCLPLTTALGDIPALAVTADDRISLHHGRKLSPRLFPHFIAGQKALATCDHQPIGLVEHTGTAIQIVRLFNIPTKGNNDVDYNNP